VLGNFQTHDEIKLPPEIEWLREIRLTKMLPRDAEQGGIQIASVHCENVSDSSIQKFPGKMTEPAADIQDALRGKNFEKTAYNDIRRPQIRSQLIAIVSVGAF